LSGIVAGVFNSSRAPWAETSSIRQLCGPEPPPQTILAPWSTEQRLLFLLLLDIDLILRLAY
jgi:hypothetical protein